MKKIIISIIIFFLQTDLVLLSQIKEPEKPYISDINDNIDFQNFKYRARVLIQGRSDPSEGDIILNSDTLICPDNRRIKVKDISRINVMLWEKRSRLNKHAFYPSRYEIFYRDYRKEIINGNIDSLNKIKSGSRKTGYIYLYYYDYFINGKWASSGAADFNPLISKPADGCVVSIELMQ